MLNQIGNVRERASTSWFSLRLKLAGALAAATLTACAATDEPVSRGNPDFPRCVGIDGEAINTNTIQVTTLSNVPGLVSQIKFTELRLQPNGDYVAVSGRTPVQRVSSDANGTAVHTIQILSTVPGVDAVLVEGCVFNRARTAAFLCPNSPTLITRFNAR